MDMVYSYPYPDVMSYSSMRHPTYTTNDYEWRSAENQQDKRVKSGQVKKSAECKGSKDSCPICQERQRRPLAKYIQQKSREERTKDASIVEEEETSEQQETKQFAAKAGTSQ